MDISLYVYCLLRIIMLFYYRVCLYIYILLHKLQYFLIAEFMRVGLITCFLLCRFCYCDLDLFCLVCCVCSGFTCLACFAGFRIPLLWFLFLLCSQSPKTSSPSTAEPGPPKKHVRKVLFDLHGWLMLGLCLCLLLTPLAINLC